MIQSLHQALDGDVQASHRARYGVGRRNLPGEREERSAHGRQINPYKPAFNTISNSAAPASVAFTLQCPYANTGI